MPVEGGVFSDDGSVRAGGLTDFARGVRDLAGRVAQVGRRVAGNRGLRWL
ncbi:MAG: hypothetical protein U0324_14440 [Polyangiales bacterium]